MQSVFYLVEILSRNRDLQVVDSIKLHLQAKVGIQQAVGSTGYHFGSNRVNGQGCPHSAPVQLNT